MRRKEGEERRTMVAIMEYREAFIFTALIAGSFHIIHEIWRFLRATSTKSFSITLCYNRHGEAWADAIVFAGLLILAVIGLILYAKEIRKKET